MDPWDRYLDTIEPANKNEYVALPSARLAEIWANTRRLEGELADADIAKSLLAAALLVIVGQSAIITILAAALILGG